MNIPVLKIIEFLEQLGDYQLLKEDYYSAIIRIPMLKIGKRNNMLSGLINNAHQACMNPAPL